MEALVTKLAELAILGFAVGYASGLFGIGGGFILTPMLVSLFDIPVCAAVGSGLAQMVIVSLIAARKHTSAGNVDGRLVAFATPGILGGGFLGTRLLHSLDRCGSIMVWGRQVREINFVISIVFVVLLAGISVRFWREGRAKSEPWTEGVLRWARGPAPVSLPVSGIDQCSAISLLLCGLTTGIMAGLLGIGGGVILIPLLVCGYGLQLRVAIGTSALLIFVSSAVGMVLYAIAGHVWWVIVVALLVGGIFGVRWGSGHSLRMSVRRLNLAFALLTSMVGVIVLLRILQ